MTFSVNKEQEERNHKLAEVIKQYDNGDAGFDEVKDAIIEDLFNGLQPEVTSEPRTTYLGPSTPHYTIRDTPLKLTCSVCKEELSGWNAHSCSPSLVKRIEALEAIVNRFICDGK
jgi:hypothetical protein